MEEELLCHIEVIKSNTEVIAKVQSDIGGPREYRSSNYEEVLEQLLLDLQEEFDSL